VSVIFSSNLHPGRMILAEWLICGTPDAVARHIALREKRDA
jgi:hypothetical protein